MVTLAPEWRQSDWFASFVIFLILMTKDRQTWHFNEKSHTKVRNSLMLISVFFCLSFGSMDSNCAQRYWSHVFLCSAIHWLYSIFWAKTNKFYTPSMSWGAFVIILLSFQVILHVRYPGLRELVLFIVFTLLLDKSAAIVAEGKKYLSWSLFQKLPPFHLYTSSMIQRRSPMLSRCGAIGHRLPTQLFV